MLFLLSLVLIASVALQASSSSIALPQTSPFKPEPPTDPSDDTKLSIRYISLNSHSSLKTLKHPFWITAPVIGASIDVFTQVSVEINYLGYYADFETRVALSIFNRHCKPGARSLDIGSHVGWFTMLSLSSGCETITVEANPDFVAMLKTSHSLTSAMNPALPQLSIFNNLVGGNSFNGLSVSEDWEVNTGRARVTLDEITLDSIIDNKPILYMKLDVEGVELQSLKTGIDSLSKVSFIMVEISLFTPNHLNAEKQIGEAVEAMRLLTAAGFTLFESGARNEAEPGLYPLSSSGIDDWENVVDAVLNGCRKTKSRYCQIEVFGSGRGWNFPGVLFAGHEDNGIVERGETNAGREHIKTRIDADGVEYLDLVFAFDVNNNIDVPNLKYYEVSVLKDVKTIENLPEELCVPIKLDVNACLEIIRQVENEIFSGAGR